MRFKKPDPVNLLELTPKRKAEWEASDGGLVVLLIPKFRHPLMVRWILPMLRSQVFRVKLDVYGSFVWKQCDGETRVHEIGERMRREFGVAAEPVYDRIGKFLRKLEQEEFIRVGRDLSADEAFRPDGASQ